MSENMEKFRHLDGAEATVSLPFVEISFQHGNPNEVGVNGCRMNDVIEAIQDQIKEFQSRDLACEENATALYHLEIAREALLLRLRRREGQGVAGQRVKHYSDPTVVKSK